MGNLTKRTLSNITFDKYTEKKLNASQTPYKFPSNILRLSDYKNQQLLWELARHRMYDKRRRSGLMIFSHKCDIEHRAVIITKVYSWNILL